MTDAVDPHSNAANSVLEAQDGTLAMKGIEGDNENNGADATIHFDSEEKPKDPQSAVQADIIVDGQLRKSENIGEIEKGTACYQSLAKEVLSDSQNLRDANRKVGTSVLSFMGPELLAEERDKVEVRSRQAMLHVAYTDIRVKNLEKEVKKLRYEIQGLPEEFEIQKVVNQVYLHKLKRSFAPEFELSEESANTLPQLQPAIEVLLGDRSSSSEETEARDDSNGRRSPEAIRIRPSLLIRHLAKVSGQSLEFGPRRGPPPMPGKPAQMSGIVFRRPFKIFCIFEKQIKASVPDLESQIEKKKRIEEAQRLGTAQETQDIKHKRMEYGDEDLLFDLKLLVEFIDHDLKSTLELRSKIKDGTATTIEYGDLWHLFELGDDVIHQSSVPNVYRVINFTGGREILIPKTHPEQKPVPVDGFAVDCYDLGFDGSSFGPKLTTFSIRQFQGARLIKSLPVSPLRLNPSAEALEEELVKRGNRYLELTRLPYSHKLLVGTTLDEPAEEIDAQIIIDMKLAINRNPNWCQDLDFDESELTLGDGRETQVPPFCTHGLFHEGCCASDIAYKDLTADRLRVDKYIQANLRVLRRFLPTELVEKDKILLPHWAYGFVLRSRQWVTVNTEDLSDVEYENNFDSLVLPDGYKDTVKALVRNHAKTSTNSTATSKVGASMDLVRGKGKGLIILLHGPPGVGKTSTAECVADLAQRPLFPVTCGDIGETAAEVQNSLDQNFQLAHKWGCVLLLDEAENKTDLRRNAVVSVFLRTLEYYSGILFLTTNRVGSIDPAFKSRIHMSLFYPHLSLEATVRVYQILLDRTLAEQKASKKVDFKVKSKEIMKFAKTHFKRLANEGLATWNGRQIRNAFQTAITLAEYSSRQSGSESTTLGKEQFQIVAHASKDFDVYMKETLGATETDLARMDNVRYDNHGARGSSHRPAARSDWSRERPLRPAGRNLNDPESETEASSDSDDDDEDGNDDGEEQATHLVGEASSRTNKGKAVSGVSMKDESATEQSEMKEYEEFKRFREMNKRAKHQRT